MGRIDLPMHSFSCPGLMNVDDSACPEAWYNAETYVGRKFKAAATRWNVAGSFHCIVRWDWGSTADVAFLQRPSNSRFILVRWILWYVSAWLTAMSQLYTYNIRNPPTSLASSNLWDFGGLKWMPLGPWSIFRYWSCGLNFQSVVCLRTLRSIHSLRSSWSLRNSGAGDSDHLISWFRSLR
jgi:hypothetical protein